MPAVGVRRAESADARELARIAEVAFSPYVERMGGLRPAPMNADYETLVRDAETWVSEVGGAIVGFLVLVWEDDAVLLDTVAVLPEHHGTGVGRRLLELTEERARVRGCRRIRLYTHATMVENQRLYARRGYVVTRSADQDGFSRVFYEKALEP
jgi:ribosomal protein S18 acetylase RimI-like enzyme